MEIIFVHGAFVRDGAWWWRPVAEIVEQATGVRSTAVALPSCGEVTGQLSPAGLAEDAAALTAVLDGLDAAVVVAHSYGGTVAAEGALHPAVRHLCYISSFLPEVGRAHGSLIPPWGPPLPLREHADGTISVDDDDRPTFDDRFLHDVTDPALIEGAHLRLAPQFGAALGQPTTRAAWQTVPSLYLVCADDRSTDPTLQREHAARAGRQVELPTGHHPFLARPELVAAELLPLLDRAG